MLGLKAANHSNKHKKKIALSTISLISLFILSACGGDSGSNASPTPTSSRPPLNNATPSASSNAPSTSSSTPLGPTTTSPAVASPSPQTSDSASPITSENYVPLFAADTPVMENIQYTEADGTLVTRAGYRPTHRHARERGEYWYKGGDFDVASGPNPVDTGPGDYFNWPELYFQYRTFGLLIRDSTPAGRSTLDIYQVVNQTDSTTDNAYIQTSLNVFRNTTTGTYAWKYNQGFTNTNPNFKNVLPDNRTDQAGQLCLSSSKLLDCYMNWALSNNWETNAPFKMGDYFEVTSAGFVDYYHKNNDPTNPEIYAKYDNGAPRFYSFEQLYVVGKGMVPWYGVAPALHTTPLPEDTLLGGMASVSYNYSEEPMRVFQQTVNNIGITDLQRFVEGRRLFHTSFADGTHSENPTINPPMKEHINQLGSRFNSERCLGCHALNGRSQTTSIGNPINTFAVLTAATSSSTRITPDPVYGLNIQQLSSVAKAPDYSVAVQSYQTSLRTLSGGETVELQKPIYAFKGPTPTQFSVRQAPQVIGMGLLEAIDESSILQLSDPNDKNGDGIRGIPNWSIDPETGQKHLGRFGWKASKGSLRQQIAGALMLDMGVTSPVFPSRDCQQNMDSTNCKTAPQTTAGISEQELQKLSHYIELIGVPAQRSLRSGFAPGLRVSPEHDVNTTSISNGAKLFDQAHCTACHVSQMKTGNTHPFAELRNQLIHPYTDLLLHDMGDGLADTLTEGNASPKMWRTQPLWGIGSLPYVQESTAEINGPDLQHGSVSNARYLHDGRARTLTEAIEWHDGEAHNSRLLFEQFTPQERSDLLAFLSSL
jgi:CxxC motif-containing protein (DUF1111 family)